MIREYKKNDLDVVISIWYEASTLAHPFLDTEFVENVKHDMRNIYIPASKTWVYVYKDNVVGFISMSENEIGGLFVLPKYHSKRIGSQLVSHVEPLYKKLEVEVFENNKIGLPFYIKLGFKLLKKYKHEQTQQVVLRLIK